MDPEHAQPSLGPLQVKPILGWVYHPRMWFADCSLATQNRGLRAFGCPPQVGPTRPHLTKPDGASIIRPDAPAACAHAAPTPCARGAARSAGSNSAPLTDTTTPLSRRAPSAAGSAEAGRLWCPASSPRIR